MCAMPMTGWSIPNASSSRGGNNSSSSIGISSRSACAAIAVPGSYRLSFFAKGSPRAPGRQFIDARFDAIDHAGFACNTNGSWPLSEAWQQFGAHCSYTPSSGVQGASATAVRSSLLHDMHLPSRPLARQNQRGVTLSSGP